MIEIGKLMDVAGNRMGNDATGTASVVSLEKTWANKVVGEGDDSCTSPLIDPSDSLTVVDGSEKVISGGSSLVTSNVPLALPPKELVAEIVTVCVPSSIVSSTPVIEKVAVDCPAKITTDAGTVASVKSLLESVTVVSVADGVDKLTVPVVVPPDSLIEASAMRSDRVDVFSSFTTMPAETSLAPTALAVTVAVCAPSTKLSSTPEATTDPDV